MQAKIHRFNPTVNLFPQELPYSMSTVIENALSRFALVKALRRPVPHLADFDGQLL